MSAPTRGGAPSPLRAREGRRRSLRETPCLLKSLERHSSPLIGASGGPGSAHRPTQRELPFASRRPSRLGFSKEFLGMAYRCLLLLCRLLRFSAHFLRFLSLWTKNTNLLNSAFRRILFKLIACINYSVSFAQGTFAGR